MLSHRSLHPTISDVISLRFDRSTLVNATNCHHALDSIPLSFAIDSRTWRTAPVETLGFIWSGSVPIATAYHPSENTNYIDQSGLAPSNNAPLQIENTIMYTSVIGLRSTTSVPHKMYRYTFTTSILYVSRSPPTALPRPSSSLWNPLHRSSHRHRYGEYPRPLPSYHAQSHCTLLWLLFQRSSPTISNWCHSMPFLALHIPHFLGVSWYPQSYVYNYIRGYRQTTHRS